ncbi:hypothetical protein QIT82_gp59 [Pseudomonas phage psageK9]|uniref:Uncharacterized protein n=2 Tax=Readingvirus TaxID=3152626 RepID=A0A6M3TE69_9CAUD|nr:MULTISPECIES: hypothetical protein [Pseudomonas syringae group]YP_010773182.1 hypothetical protein QIT81_gp70 [Pseudomonas phage MR15]YP_010773265.1 hypothetical protein QIT82_gp59 [Pseudomonas phage psageK9]QJD55131.1 hypothetical protein Psm1vBMR13_gp69 [Pseudomonas phage MR13]QXV71632.1 hypothetical protein psageB2_055 [Pseudomonas phage psageB2]MBI6727697.1 hypothetical protein [Pseudomonas amygdali]MBI6810736.1 hypothetical protein [Pseudomonas amygdali]MDG6439123.1 hypothetical prot
MSTSEQFWVVVFVVIVIGVIVGHFVEIRRNRSIQEFERRRRERKAEVERAARKSL